MDDERLGQIERRLNDLDRRESATERALERAMSSSRQAMGHILPSRTRHHLRNAGRENLLAIRSMLDHWVEQLETKPEERDKPAGERENIPID